MGREQMLQTGKNGRRLSLPHGERKLIAAMRRKIREDGSRVEFKEDHNGDLIAVEKVLHRASDFT